VKAQVLLKVWVVTPVHLSATISSIKGQALVASLLDLVKIASKGFAFVLLVPD
jgi:hypothetical protein